MGRPIKKIYFGPATPNGTQLACEAWVNGDSQSRSGFIVRQASSNSYWVQTSYGVGLCWLSDTVNQPETMRIQIVAEGFSGISYAKKITDGEMYTWDNKYFPSWKPINGQMVYGTVDTGNSWIASYGDFENDSNYTAGEGVAYDSVGNLLIVGSAGGGGGFPSFILKLSPEGEVIWQKTTTIFYGAEAVVCDPDDNIYVVLRGDNQAGCIKLDSDGELVWAREISNMNTPVDVTLKSDNSVAFCSTDGTIAWLNPDGTVKYIISVDDTGIIRADFSSVEFIGNNLAVASPYINDSTEEEGVHLMMLSDTGTVLWQTAYHCPTDNVTDYGTFVDSDASGNLYVQTRWRSFNPDIESNERFGWFAKFNSSGVLQWQTQVVDNDILLEYRAFSLRVTPDGYIYSCGTDNEDGLSFVKLNPDGTLDWAKNLLTETSFGVWWNWGNKDIDIFNDRFIMTGHQSLVERNESYAFITCLPTDGSGDGTYGIYTYQDADMTASAASWQEVELSYTLVDPELGNFVPEIEIINISYGIQITNFE